MNSWPAAKDNIHCVSVSASRESIHQSRTLKASSMSTHDVYITKGHRVRSPTVTDCCSKRFPQKRECVRADKSLQWSYVTLGFNAWTMSIQTTYTNSTISEHLKITWRYILMQIIGDNKTHNSISWSASVPPGSTLLSRTGKTLFGLLWTYLYI